MTTSTTAFSVGDLHGDLAGVIAALTEEGFRFGPSRPVTTALLDTFDGRLHAAGLRLDARVSGSVELVLSGDDTVAAQITTASMPRFPADLPPGPFRARIADAVDVRALLVRLRFSATRTSGALLDRAGKTLVAATVHQNVRVIGEGRVALGSMVEIDEVVGYDKPARRAVDVLDRLGVQRVIGGLREAVADAAGVDLAGFSDSPTVPLDAAMPAIDGFRAVVANLAATIAANWDATMAQLDPEFLHDLRVAVRRTRSVLAQGRKVLPAPVDERAREGFGWLGALTGPARDLDVYLVEWEGYTASLGVDAVAALAPVRALLVERREAAYASLMESMRSSDATELLAWWDGWLRGPAGADPPGADAGRPLGRVVATRINRAQDTLIELGRLIGPDTPAEEVHSLRKDAKKLRYLLECFGSLLPEPPRRAFVQRLKTLQDNLGEHQDAEVHVAELQRISRHLHGDGASPDTMVTIGRLSERLDQRRRDARSEFAARFAAYDTKATERALEAALDGLAG